MRDRDEMHGASCNVTDDCKSFARRHAFDVLGSNAIPERC